MKSEAIIGAVQSVTKAWAKQRKSEERGSRRPRSSYYSSRVNFSDIAHQVLPKAYEHASGGGQLPVAQRQMYYASRDEFQRITGRVIDSTYFTQTILRKYLNQHDVDWKITADPRGSFTIPNADHEVRIPVGTLAINKYLTTKRRTGGELDIEQAVSCLWPSLAENQRYGAVLYIEKEGFEPLLKEARIAERFDLAILSCKGQSVAAARKLVDHVCRVDGGVPLFVVHDFDQAGFQIASCLTTESDYAVDTDRVAYHFENEINVTDFGLRLEDVREYSLASEKVKPRNLRLLNATDEENAYFMTGRRVELNAFTAPQFVEWLEAKLRTHLPERLIPEDEILARAYRRAVAARKINRELSVIIDSAKEAASLVEIPNDLRQRVSEAIAESGDIPWDEAINGIVGDEEASE